MRSSSECITERKGEGLRRSQRTLDGTCEPASRSVAGSERHIRKGAGANATRNGVAAAWAWAKGRALPWTGDVAHDSKGVRSGRPPCWAFGQFRTDIHQRPGRWAGSKWGRN